MGHPKVVYYKDFRGGEAMRGQFGRVYRRWVHSACDVERDAIVRGALESETIVIRLKKQYDDLMEAHRSLVAATTYKQGADTFSRMLAEMFEETPVNDEDKVFLTPEQEGL